VFVLSLFVFAWVGGVQRELLRGEVVHVQGHAPAVGRVPDLRDAAAELPAERTAVGGRGHGGGLRGGQGPHVAWPAAAAEPLRPLLGQPRQPEGLVEEAAVHRVPVAERVPAGAAQERERHAALGHGCGARGRGAEKCGAAAPDALLWVSSRVFLAGGASGLY
uniref:Uncharacterized protein n=1 Tax=Oryctolagus cuniculus TaxID=9986 RepID=G1TRF1_RABIT